MFAEYRKALTLARLQFIEDTFPWQEQREVATPLYPFLFQMTFLEDWVTAPAGIMVLLASTLAFFPMQRIYTAILLAVYVPFVIGAIQLLRRRTMNKIRRLHENQRFIGSIALRIGYAKPSLHPGALRINNMLCPPGPSPAHPRRIYQ